MDYCKYQEYKGVKKNKQFHRIEATRVVFITDDEANFNNSQKFNSGLEYEKIEEPKKSSRKKPAPKPDEEI